MSLPVTILIDDPAPLVNTFWWHASATQNTDDPRQADGQPVPREVPVDFMEEFCDVVEECGIRGKFSVLPYPIGLGSIVDGWEGCDLEGMERWLALTRERVVPLMDITPEILTHAEAVDIDNMTLLDENEQDWAFHQTETTLTPYIALSLRLLNQVGLEASGVTSPWYFGHDVEPDYQRAIRKAMQEVNRRGQTWYFLHIQTGGTDFHSQVVYQEGEQWLVSLCSQCKDYLWATMDTTDSSDAYIRSVADRYLTEDGQEGRFAELFNAGTPIVFHSHWQSFYSNGRHTGLQALAEVAKRMQKVWGSDVQWVKCSQLAESIAMSVV
jgi:hypothetical protein